MGLTAAKWAPVFTLLAMGGGALIGGLLGISEVSGLMLVGLTANTTLSLPSAFQEYSNANTTREKLAAGFLILTGLAAQAGGVLGCIRIYSSIRYSGISTSKSTTRLGTSSGYEPFGPNSVGAAQRNVKVPGYGWKDKSWWKMVKKVQQGESIQVRTVRQAAEIRKDAFPNYVRSKYRGNLSEMPDIRGTYDWHIHGGKHSIPHLQIKTTTGRWIRIEVTGK